MSIKPTNKRDHKRKNRNARYKQNSKQKEDKNNAIIDHCQNLLCGHRNQNRRCDQNGQND